MTGGKKQAEARLPEGIRRRGNKFQAIVQIRAPDGSRQTFSAMADTEWDAVLRRVELLAAAGRLDSLKGRATVDELLTAWIQVAAGSWSPATQEANRHYVERYIRPALGAMELRKLTRAIVDGFYADAFRQGVSERPLAPSSVRRLHNVLSRALEQAVRWEWIGVNPARGATLPKMQPPRITPPAPDVLVDILEQASALDPELGLFFVLASVTGARRGELCALQWQDLDFKCGSITIRHALSGPNLELVAPKAHSIRAISVDPATMALLTDHKAARTETVEALGGHLHASSFVFARDLAGAQPVRPDSMTRRWAKLAAASGHGGVRLHDLRHFVATRLLASGVDVVTVAHRLGHGSGERVTLQRYARFIAGKDRAAADVLGELVRRPTD